MTKRKMIVTAACVLLLAGCGASPAATTAHVPAAEPDPVSSTAAENLGMTMLAWEFQTAPEQKALCARVRAEGVSGTVEAYRARHGGAAADWTASATWLVSTCERERDR